MKINHFFCIGIVGLTFFLQLSASCKKSPENLPESADHMHGIIPLPLSVDLSDGNLTVNKNLLSQVCLKIESDVNPS